MKVKGLIFDYGGTLDTGGNHWGKVLWHAYERHGMPVTEEQFREAYVHGERTLGRNPIVKPHFTFRETLEHKLRLQFDYLSSAGACLNDDMLNVLLDDVYAQTLCHTAHSVDVLNSLIHRGMPMVLVSNFYGNIQTVLSEFGFNDLFLTIIESAVVGVRKPDPQIFRLGVDALGLLPEEVLVVGDSMDKDIVPARIIGSRTVWIKGEPWNDAPVDRSSADYIVSDLEELLKNNII